MALDGTLHKTHERGLLAHVPKNQKKFSRAQINTIQSYPKYIE